jgi:hypothetical protein
MNRIRQFNNKYQVLITPSHHCNVSFELMMGGWTDERLRNYYILEFDTLGEAQYEAFKYPDLDWEKMVMNFKHAYSDLKEHITKVLDDNKFNSTVDAVMMTPSNVKTAMFNRVMNSNNFTLANELNDVIHYIIANPWTKNCIAIANSLISYPDLRIMKQISSNGAIVLIGKTELGLSYRISIFPSLIHQWYQWSLKNPNVADDVKFNHYLKMTKLQNKIDTDYILR